MSKRGLVLLEANRTRSRSRWGQARRAAGREQLACSGALRAGSSAEAHRVPGQLTESEPRPAGALRKSLGPPSSTSSCSVWSSDSPGQRAGPCRYPLESRGRGRHGSPYAAYRVQGLLEGAWWPGRLIESVEGQERALPLPSSAVWAYGPGSNAPSAAATLAGLIRDTISARSVKEALGQVSTWGAEAKETSGQAPDRSRPHPLYDPLWS